MPTAPAFVSLSKIAAVGHRMSHLDADKLAMFQQLVSQGKPFPPVILCKLTTYAPLDPAKLKIRENEKNPPVLVQQSSKDAYLISDGHYRVKAALMEHKDCILAIVDENANPPAMPPRKKRPTS